jgi:hypothetical protein
MALTVRIIVALYFHNNGCVFDCDYFKLESCSSRAMPIAGGHIGPPLHTPYKKN